MNSTNRPYCGIAILSACFVSLFIISTYAYAAPSGIEGVTTRISTALQSSAITSRMLSMGKAVFSFLAVLQFIWAIYQLALDNRLEIQAMVMTIIRQIIYLGMFLMIVNEGPVFLLELGTWLADAGSSISGATAIDTIFNLGLDVGWNTITAAQKAFAISELGSSIAGLIVAVFSAMIIIITFAFAGISALVASCKIYFVASVGALCLGFSGNSYTKDIAINAIRASLACGAELMTIYILIGLSNSVFASFSAEANVLQPNQIIAFALQTLVASIIFAGMVLTLPGFIASFFFGGGSGGSAATSSGISMARTAAIAGMAGAATAAKTARAYTGTWNHARNIAESPGRYVRGREQPGGGTGENHPNYVDP